MINEKKVKQIMLETPNGVNVSTIQRQLKLGYVEVYNYLNKLVEDKKAVCVDGKYKLI